MIFKWLPAAGLVRFCQVIEIKSGWVRSCWAILIKTSTVKRVHSYQRQDILNNSVVAKWFLFRGHLCYEISRDSLYLLAIDFLVFASENG